MPWLETAPVDERIRFIQDALSDRFTMSALLTARLRKAARTTLITSGS